MSGLLHRLSDEADLCRNDGAEDIAKLLSDASEVLAQMTNCLTECLEYSGGADHALDDPYVVERINDALAKVQGVAA